MGDGDGDAAVEGNVDRDVDATCWPRRRTALLAFAVAAELTIAPCWVLRDVMVVVIDVRGIRDADAEEKFSVPHFALLLPVT